MTSINLRINELAVKFFEDNNSKFAKKLSTSEANIRNYRSNREPKIEFLNKLAAKLEISYEWLLTGNGEMLKGAETPVKQEEREEKHCAFENSCEMRKNEALFLNANTLIKEVNEVREFQRKYIKLLESYNTMTILFAKAHMKLLHLFYFARQQKDAEKAVDLKIAEKILHDMDEVEEKLQHA
jgi:transcriptional regulator with XRE-family HTH domain